MVKQLMFLIGFFFSFFFSCSLCLSSWEAGQVLARKLMLGLVADFQQNRPLVLNPKFVHGLKSILLDSSLDKVFMKQCFFS